MEEKSKPVTNSLQIALSKFVSFIYLMDFEFLCLDNLWHFRIFLRYLLSTQGSVSFVLRMLWVLLLALERRMVRHASWWVGHDFAPVLAMNKDASTTQIFVKNKTLVLIYTIIDQLSTIFSSASSRGRYSMLSCSTWPPRQPFDLSNIQST